MLCQRLSYPAIFSLVGSDYHHKVVSNGIVRVEKIGDHPYEAESTRKYDKLIFRT